jgi:hypothetical protein
MYPSTSAAVELLALEAALDEERAAAPQDGPERKEAQVLTGRDERGQQLTAVEHGAQHQVVHVALVAGEQHDGAVARLLAQPLDAVFVDDDAVVDAVPDPVEEARQLGDHVGLLVGAQLAELFARFLLHLGDAAARAARLVLDVLANARAAQEVVLDAAERLLGGPEDQRALALHAPQQGVAHLVGELRVGELGVLGQERLQVRTAPPSAAARSGS